ncbi:sulfatase family protein [Aureliella helgolandensis]|uniref:Arylsulfatase n=1 Tax=Aureliella helgolandensis TaxID=2527968 RepID=A0A518G1N3_9BACT|nr:sulfatase-like hydrolase/transferase [Aureliella helgolandensis]QDV22495.1 Arylsulfatase [Aureliella helgolandensis]
MSPQKLLQLAGVLAALLAPSNGSRAETLRDSRPNIVVVVADDMGWGDCATYGHEIIQSPNLDKLAAEGVKFTQGYSACGVCSPSRSAILTGRTPYRNGVYRHLSGIHEAHLRASEITYPQLLKTIGYQTCHVGKWHLLSRQQFGNPEYPQPGQQGGYDYWMATQNNAEPSHKNPNNFIRNGEAVGETVGYSAPLVADEAIHWLADVRDASKPFVLSAWFHEPHKPIATDRKFSALYPGQSERDSTYFGNITQLDFALGKIIETLEAQGVADNTLLIFTSDNGPVPSSGGSTGGLRGNKRNDYEGGIRVPFLARWPGHIQAGTVSDTPVIGTDIFSTVLDIVGIPLPKDRAIDGASMLPVFAGNTIERKIPMFWRTHVSPPGDRVAMRIGNWKMVANDTLSAFQLFDAQKDWQEKDNLAAKMPAKTAEMKAILLQTWNDIVEEGPNEWWEAETQKPARGGTLSY